VLRRRAAPVMSSPEGAVRSVSTRCEAGKRAHRLLAASSGPVIHAHLITPGASVRLADVVQRHLLLAAPASEAKSMRCDRFPGTRSGARRRRHDRFGSAASESVFHRLGAEPGRPLAAETGPVTITPNRSNRLRRDLRRITGRYDQSFRCGPDSDMNGPEIVDLRPVLWRLP
jgi:hypothetical protein